MNALEKYLVTFAKVEKGNHSYLDIDSVNDWLSLIILNHKFIPDANSLLDGINTAINENWQNSDWGFQTQGTVIAIVDSDNTRIYEDVEEYTKNKRITPAFILPTEDFKQIVEAWIQYLQNNSSTHNATEGN